MSVTSTSGEAARLDAHKLEQAAEELEKENTLIDTDYTVHSKSKGMTIFLSIITFGIYYHYYNKNHKYSEIINKLTTDVDHYLADTLASLKKMDPPTKEKIEENKNKYQKLTESKNRIESAMEALKKVDGRSRYVKGTHGTADLAFDFMSIRKDSSFNKELNNEKDKAIRDYIASQRAISIKTEDMVMWNDILKTYNGSNSNPNYRVKLEVINEEIQVQFLEDPEHWITNSIETEKITIPFSYQKTKEGVTITLKGQNLDEKTSSAIKAQILKQLKNKNIDSLESEVVLENQTEKRSDTPVKLIKSFKVPFTEGIKTLINREVEFKTVTNNEILEQLSNKLTEVKNNMQAVGPREDQGNLKDIFNAKKSEISNSVFHLVDTLNKRVHADAAMISETADKLQTVFSKYNSQKIDIELLSRVKKHNPFVDKF